MEVSVLEPSHTLLLMGAGLVQVRVLVVLQAALHLEPFPHADQPAVITQLGCFVATVMSAALHAVFSVDDPSQSFPPFDFAWLLQ